MKYIQLIDDMGKVQTFSKGRWVVAKPEEGYGLLKWEIRFRHAIACLRGKAVAVRFHHSK